MFHSKKFLWLITLSIMLGFACILAAHASGDTSKPRVMDGGLWRYGLKRNHNTGTILAKISVDFANLRVVNAYKQLNQQYASSVISARQARDVDVTLTFASPLSWEDVEALREETSLSVQLYTFVALNQNGEKGSLTSVERLDSPVNINKATEIITSQGYTLQGIMVVHGTVPNTPEGLGKLVADSRVYLADVMANRVREDLLERGGLSDTQDLHVHTPSPFWDMDWD